MAELPSPTKESRLQMVCDLVKAEQLYVSQLVLLRDLYVVPIRETGLLKTKYYTALFSQATLDSIITLNTHLLESLRSLVYGVGGAIVFDPLKTRLGKAFLEFVQFLKMYQRYAEKHESGMRTLKKLQSNRTFQDYCEDKRLDPRCKGQDLKTLLLLPIARVPRYECFFSSLLRHTSDSHPDFVDLVQCKEQVSKVKSMINAAMRKADAIELVLNIEARCVPKKELIAPARRFIREAHLVKVSRKKDIRYNFVLFSDCLLYCTETAVGSGLLKWHHLLEFDEYFRVVDITTPNKKYGVSCFEIHSVVKSFLVFTGTPEVKAEWLGLFHECLEKLRRRRGERGSKDAMYGMKRTQPVWFPDDFSDVCMLHTCKKKFTLRRRRHHCRYCGRLVCDDCSKKKLPDVHYSAKGKAKAKAKDKKKMGRVCDVCFMQYKGFFPEVATKSKKRERRRKSQGFLGGFSQKKRTISDSESFAQSVTVCDSEDELPEDSSDDEMDEDSTDTAPGKKLSLDRALSMSDSEFQKSSRRASPGRSPWQTLTGKLSGSGGRLSPRPSPLSLAITPSITTQAKGGSHTPAGTSSASKILTGFAPMAVLPLTETTESVKADLESERRKTEDLGRVVRELTLANDKLQHAKSGVEESYEVHIKALKQQLAVASQSGSDLGIGEVVAADSDWKREEGIGSFDGFALEVFRAETTVKVRAKQSEGGGGAFEAVFDNGALAGAGMDSRLTFAENLEIIVGWLKGEYATVKVLADDCGAVVIVTETIRRKTQDYRLQLAALVTDHSDVLRAELGKAKAELREAVAVATAAKKQLADAKLESGRLEKASAMTDDRKDAHVSELLQRAAFLEEESADAKASNEQLTTSLKAAELRLAESSVRIRDLESQVRVRDLCIAQSVSMAELKEDTADSSQLTEFSFDRRLQKGGTLPSLFSFSRDCRMARKSTIGWSQVLLQPAASGGKHSVDVLIEDLGDLFAIGLSDDCGKWVLFGCAFCSRGNVYVSGKEVAHSQSFGGWHPGNRIQLVADLDSGKVHIQAPNGEYTGYWKPRQFPVYFGILVYNSGTALTLL